MVVRKEEPVKYHQRKRIWKGMTFDSTLERNRYIRLQAAVQEGVISELRRQVRFELVPAQYEDVEVQLKTKTKIVTKCVERPVAYIADFTYRKGDGYVIEDTKGFRTPDYIIKRKIMRYQGNPIREVLRANEEI